MIIHEPDLFKKDDHTIIFSRIEMCHPTVNFPEYLWYKVPDRYAQYLSLQSDAFLIPGLLAGMYFHEDIEVCGTVSPRLAYHLNEYQYLLHFRMPKAVSPVDIKYDQLKPLQANPRAIGTTFSGGVDSLFTLWKHLPKNQPDPDYQITHALFILGFDIVNADKQNYQSLYSGYFDALKKFNIELIPLETNLVSLIIPRMRYVHFYGPVLIGAAYVFGKLFNKFFIPSSRDYWQIHTRTSSSDPTTDPLLSTNTLEIIHHGAAYRRVEKIEAIRDCELAHDHLRVCQSGKPDEHLMNCSRCEKCVRTMIPIYALGKMEYFKTFAKPFTSNRQILWWARKFDPSKDYVDEIFPFIRRIKPNLIHWLRAAALLGYFRYMLLKLIPKPIRLRLHRFGLFVDHLAVVNAFEDPELSDLIRSKRI
jgi:hypothetical protein